MMTEPTPFDDTYTIGTDCTNGNIWCTYQEPHRHGSFDCDRDCPCWQARSASKRRGETADPA